VSGGTPQGAAAVGQVLTCLPGMWKGAPAPVLAVQWLRDGANIPGATTVNYEVRSEDRGTSLSCRVLASSSEGETQAPSSNRVEVPGNEPRDVTLPKVSGTPAVGETLLCTPGSWSGQPLPTFTYQWLLGGAEIPAATQSSYTVSDSDRGASLSCKVTAANAAGARSASSEAVHVPGVKPEMVEAPQVSGTPAVGLQLRCLRGLWNGQPPPAFAYQWLRDGTAVPSATNSSYTVELADQGHSLSCRVTASNGEGSAEAQSNSVAIPHLGGENRPEQTFSSAPLAPPGVAQILAALRKQLARAQHHARISSLRRKGTFSFSLTAPAGGTLELVWYQSPTGGGHSSNAKPLTIATCTTSLVAGGTKTVKLRLTSAGRRALEHSTALQLTLKAVFTQAHSRPLVWQKTVGLTY
jgi:hypothetical protein